MALGRGFVADEARTAGIARVAVLSHRLWETGFGRDPQVLGRGIRLNGREYRIIGVTAPGFRGIEVFADPQIWVPVTMYAEFGVTNPALNILEEQVRFMAAVGRLRPGSSIAAAQAELQTIASALAAADPKNLANLSIRLSPDIHMSEWFRGDVERTSVLLTALVGVLLLITTANLANLLLARATVRRAEIALRLSLGATRAAIVKQGIVESLVLTSAAAVAGLVIAYWVGDLVIRAAGDVPVRSQIDGRVVAFAAVVAVLTGLVMGLGPALRSSRTDLISGLKGKALHLYSGAPVRNGLVVAQIALTVALVAIAAVLVRTVASTGRIDVGFPLDPLSFVSIDLRSNGYTDASAREFCERLLRATADLPGVRAASISAQPPVSGWVTTADILADGKSMRVSKQTVSREFLRTLESGLAEGREFTRADAPTTFPVAMVNEALARRVWGHESAIGRTIQLVSPFGTKSVHIIGVARDLRHNPRNAAQASIYVPLTQHPEPNVTLVVNAAAPVRDTHRAIEAAIKGLDPNLAIGGVMTARETVRQIFSEQRFVATNCAVFGVVAMLIAMLGIYGVVSYTVAQRTHEFGVRLAVGATGADIRRLVLGQALLLAAAGIAIGLALSAAGSPAVKAYVAGVEPLDPASFGISAALLSAVAATAAYVPASRAMRVNPVDALRDE
jgi:predicted permease